MSAVYRWFSSLSQKAKLGVGVGLMAYGVAGLYLSDRAEEAFDMVPSEADKDKLKSMVPTVRAVERNTPGDDGKAH